MIAVIPAQQKRRQCEIGYHRQQEGGPGQESEIEYAVNITEQKHIETRGEHNAGGKQRLTSTQKGILYRLVDTMSLIKAVSEMVRKMDGIIYRDADCNGGD